MGVIELLSLLEEDAEDCPDLLGEALFFFFFLCFFFCFSQVERREPLKFAHIDERPLLNFHTANKCQLYVVEVSTRLEVLARVCAMHSVHCTQCLAGGTCACSCVDGWGHTHVRAWVGAHAHASKCMNGGTCACACVACAFLLLVISLSTLLFLLLFLPHLLLLRRFLLFLLCLLLFLLRLP